MKKLLSVLISLYAIYFAAEYLLFRFGKGHDIVYTIVDENRNYDIKENLVTNQKNNDDFYSFNINNKFYFRIYDSLKRQKNVIKSIKYYQDNQYECIYPVFRGENVPIDVLCSKDNRMIHYHDIKGTNSGLDQFVQKLDGYESKYFEDNTSSNEKINLVSFYPNNFDKKIHIVLMSYKGLYNLSKNNSKEIKLFSNDVYNNNIYALVGKYFVTANYNLEHEFSSFLTVDLNNNIENEINYNGNLSFDTYVQGVVEDSMYVFDPKSELQYKVTPKNNKVKMTNEDGEIRYYNGTEFKMVDSEEATSSKLLFKTNDNKGDGLTSKGELSGYKYNLENVNNRIEVNRQYLNGEGKTYLFSANEVRNISFYKDMIFFVDGNTIKVYSDMTGLRTLLSMDELTFNKNLNYYVYVK